MRILQSLVLAAVAALGFLLPSVAAERAIIVLDGSGSMWAQIDGTARITIARETLNDVLQSLPDDLELGFMTYGHREKGNCTDIELLVPPAPGMGEAIGAAAADINPKGMTPLSDAVRMAAEELRYTEERATVILITDGLETCEVDPCDLGFELESAGIDFTTHVVGFGLSDDEGRQVACLAENTGGTYLPANDADALTSALTLTVAEVVEPEPEPEPAPEPEPVALEFNLSPEAVMAEGGEPIVRSGTAWNVYEARADGSRGEGVTYGYGNPFETSLEPGDYIIAIKEGEVEMEQAVTVAAEEVARPRFILNAATVTLRAYAAEGGPVAEGAALNLYYPGGDTYGYGEETFIVPAGEVTATAKVGQGEVSETFTIAAGETIERDLVAGVGRVVVNAAYVEGMKVEAGGLGVNVFKASASIDGSREEVGYGFGPDTGYDLPPGDYVAVVKMDDATAEVAFTVETGKSVEVVGVLEAGVVAITAAGTDRLNIYSGKADIQGNRKEFGYSYDEEYQQTLPAGKYVVVAHFPDDVEKEVPFTVAAGDRVDVTVE
ncbi:vWA domain-containing protein [Devosia nitrariae]|uniref:VWA domain-containing protein n=1 Tax=Devosia nitrariae TaxID=2071872 RepID=A0ABQ5WBV8_9HYPH|nr:VWA domain-containing protein [Devosia nitrariae]GLQ57363.1 VWA domain-containing protein [Devosia nitrariae]